jgi:hypothetical protein
MSISLKSRCFPVLFGAAMAGALTFAPAQARAEGPVSPTGKGIAGGALLGGEVVMITTAIIGVKAWWPYLVFGAVGAGGGAVGGYFVEQVDDGNTPEPSLYMLAGGLALVIPTIVAVANATAYDPSEDEEGFDEEDGEGEGEEPGVEVDVNAETGKRRPIPMALMGIDLYGKHARVSPGIPAVAVTPMYSPKEIATYGVEQETVVRVPLVTGSF